MMQRSLKGMLKDTELVVGMQIQQVCAPWIAKVYADVGADFVFMEYEHMSFNQAQLADFVLSCRLCGLPVVSKCAYLDRSVITRLLDAGITGIQLPWTETSAEAVELVRYMKFPPAGIRAAAPGIGNTEYELVDAKEWVKQANEDTIAIAHVETKTGVDNIDQILAVSEIDIMYIGLFDLTISMGRAGEFEDAEVKNALARLIDAAKAHQKIAGMWAPSYELARPWIERGVRFMEIGSDVGFIMNGARNLMKQFPGHGPKETQGQAHH